MGRASKDKRDIYYRQVTLTQAPEERHCMTASCLANCS